MVIQGEERSKFVPNWIKTAQIYPIMKDGRDILVKVLPEHFNEHMEFAYEAVSKKNIDERYMRYMIAKLEDYLTKSELQKLER